MWQSSRQLEASTAVLIAKANQDALATPQILEMSPPSAAPIVMPPCTATRFTLPIRPCNAAGTARWRTVVDVVRYIAA